AWPPASPSGRPPPPERGSAPSSAWRPFRRSWAAPATSRAISRSERAERRGPGLGGWRSRLQLPEGVIVLVTRAAALTRRGVPGALPGRDGAVPVPGRVLAAGMAVGAA